ncbi:hypothetical protein K505DRAFT_363451 [Melanomma pulvis-pyrius CBS 109.77]|uniref:Uncharacterized protein n=1 Tax=Melanomma pulvis-pyrius CBS 109.77 TaxID=1314802 RepID=A0A6A6X723_9PLEO|nr:hypothetical protein K505DRAFT_363451 [Melanomma pulvis-pyrius CBS 109.77]
MSPSSPAATPKAHGRDSVGSILSPTSTNAGTPGQDSITIFNSIECRSTSSPSPVPTHVDPNHESTSDQHLNCLHSDETSPSVSTSATSDHHDEDTDLLYEGAGLQSGILTADRDEIYEDLADTQGDIDENSTLFEEDQDELAECTLLSEGSGYMDEVAANGEDVSVTEDQGGNENSYISQEGYSYVAEDDHDDIEDAISLPSSKEAPHRPQDLGSIISHEREPTLEEVGRLRQRRKELEEVIESDRIKHDQDEEVFIEGSSESGPSLEDLQEHAGAVALTPGVVVVDTEKLDKLLSSGAAEDGAVVFMKDQESSNHIASLASDKGSVLSHNMPSHVTTPQRSTEPGLPSFNPKNASEADKIPSVVQTPNGKHVEFAKGSSVFETPFTKTLNFFKANKAKENSPHKPRRNASLPEEIAKLARETHVADMDDESEDRKDLDQYRDMDLAPEDHILENGAAGDLMIAHTPNAKAAKQWNEETTNKAYLTENLMVTHSTSNTKAPTYSLDIPGHYGDSFKMEIRTNASSLQIATFIRQRGEELDASEENINSAVENFLTSPELFVVDPPQEEPSSSTVVNSNDSKEVKEYEANELEDPVFIKVIGMIPKCMFWAVAQPIAHYSSLAFDKALEKLTGLSL